ncbi:MAG: cupin domain-containing protein, partial [Paracoccaceae bacterium]
MTYAFPPGGLPDQSENPEGTAVFTDAYAVLPANTQRDIVTSLLPGWVGARAWILARPLSGFAETFAQYALELAPKGGSDTPEPDPEAQAVLFVASGSARLKLGNEIHDLRAGSFAFIPAGTIWTLWNESDAPCGIHW